VSQVITTTRGNLC